MSDKIKKQVILNLPYVILGLIATNLGEAWRLAGTVRDFSSSFPESPSQFSSVGFSDWAGVWGRFSDCCISAGEEREEIPP